MYVLDGYANAYPDDETGPCEGWQRDAEVCNTLTMLDSLWIPGWALLVLGMVVAVIGIYGPSKTTQTAGGYPCPTCDRPMTWIPAHKRWFCRYCQKYG